MMKEYEVMMKFVNGPSLTVTKKARTESGARFSAILEARLNGFDNNVIDTITITEMK